MLFSLQVIKSIVYHLLFSITRFLTLFISSSTSIYCSPCVFASTCFVHNVSLGLDKLALGFLGLKKDTCFIFRPKIVLTFLQMSPFWRNLTLPHPSGPNLILRYYMVLYLMVFLVSLFLLCHRFQRTHQHQSTPLS